MEASTAQDRTPAGGAPADDARAVPVDVVIDDTTDDTGQAVGTAVEESRLGATAGLGATLVPEGGRQSLVIGEDFYTDEGGDPSLYGGDHDPLSAAVGHDGYMQDHRMAECFMKFGDGTWTEPEKFDRYYFNVPVLIDVLRTDSDEERKFEAEARHTSFKRAWCERNEVEYLVLNQTDLVDEAHAKRALAAARGEEPETTAAKPARKPRQRGGASRSEAKGKVQRPRARKA